MVSNSRIILENLVRQQQAEIAPHLALEKYFELFVAEQVLKDYDLSYDELEGGQVGNGGDGGIDCIYGFVNGDLITDDSDVSNLRRDISLDLYIIQAKHEATFAEGAIDRLLATTQDLLDLSKEIEGFKALYNAELLRTISKFREVYAELAPRFPTLRIIYCYCSKGYDIHPNVRTKSETLKTIVGRLFPSCEVSFRFFGSEELLNLAHQRPSTTFSLTVSETPISTGAAGFVCLVSLRDYFSFITATNGQLQRRILEANVRDYEGSTEVNQGIRDTLTQGDSSEDFWWLNNGITVISTKASLAGKVLTVADPQVVNGLQTSIEIYNFFHNNPGSEDNRNLLVRVVVPNNEETRDRIIRFTNSQTRIPDASLRATDKIHRDIEVYFRTNGLFYDRRKNAHKNAGRPKDQIVSIPYLAQAIMAIVLREPDNARARPSSLIKRNQDYIRVFNERYPIDLYLRCANLMKHTDNFLRSNPDPEISYQRNNLKFHLAMFAVSMKVSKVDYESEDLYGLSFDDIDDLFMSSCLSHVIDVFDQQIFHEQEGAVILPDQVAKSPQFVEALEERLSSVIPKREMKSQA